MAAAHCLTRRSLFGLVLAPLAPWREPADDIIVDVDGKLSLNALKKLLKEGWQLTGWRMTWPHKTQKTG